MQGFDVNIGPGYHCLYSLFLGTVLIHIEPLFRISEPPKSLTMALRREVYATVSLFCRIRPIVLRVGSMPRKRDEQWVGSILERDTEVCGSTR
jgi:hypothetical protein